MQGGGGPLLTGNSAQSVPDMSSRIYFGICPTIPVARNAGQTLNQVQGDKISSLRAVVDRVAIKSTLVLRLAFSCSTRGKRAYVLSALRTPLAHANATARACAKERAGIAGLITLRQSLPTYRGSASGTPRRALDSTQGKPCSVALLGLAFTMAEILLSGASYRDASTKCRSFDNARMPNKEELASLLYNKILIGNFANNTASHYWSSTFYDENNAWLLGVDGVYRNYSKDYYVGTVRCIKR